MNLIIAIVAVIAGQRYLGIGDWIWWLFGIMLVLSCFSRIGTIRE